ncbi:DUF2535 family protein [Bacillus sp. HMF5848]|uniref:DUF2535 family protein n=1 Tax=Bacillus sp. HMF5848 TaxID=2495421 RepID=UPI000F7B4B01|nr:DUF2535 family protein [Bacillus sp. HMF5848]RSK27287.1 DUF2535 family protein [Bacillus sp. HMF5848]
MLFKSLEFKCENGQKVKVIEIPVFDERSSYKFMVDIRLQSFLAKVNYETKPKKVYSFREYLKKNLKWRDYERIYSTKQLKNNA